MVHQVNYNGQIHEFPDAATPEMMSKALGLSYEPTNKKINPNISERIKPALEQFGSDIKDIAYNAPGAIVKGIAESPGKLIEAVPNIYNQVMTDPSRAGRNLYGGLAQLGHGTVNFPREVANYANKIGLIKPETARKIPFQNDISEAVKSFVGGNSQRGDKELQSITKNLTSILPTAKVISYINPMKLTSKNIVKDILKSEKSNKELFSNKYSNLFREAENMGHGKFEKLEFPKLNIETLKKYTPNPNKKLESLNLFTEKPSLELAQKSISELGHIIRPLENKTSLMPFQKKQLEAAMDAKKHIQENMFINSEGKLNKDLLKKHNEIQKGYSKEVIPYTTDKSIKEFKQGNISKKELINRLSKKPKIREKHKAIGIREKIPYIGAAGLAGTGGAYLINKLLGKE